MGKTILLANDDVAYAARLKHELIEQGFLVILKGETAGTRTLKTMPDAIVVDFTTLEQEQVLSLKTLQSATQQYDVPVILLTKYPNPSFVQRIAEYLPVRSCVAKAEHSPTGIVSLISQQCLDYSPVS